jgi:Asp-tRNA(Asn)/Glu-tRNA(Gln) amidotransferase C subunit
MPERLPQLAHLEFLGDATKFATQIQALIPKCSLLEHFSLAEVSTLAHFMDVYRAETGMEVIREGDGGDFMLMRASRPASPARPPWSRFSTARASRASSSSSRCSARRS